MESWRLLQSHFDKKYTASEGFAYKRSPIFRLNISLPTMSNIANSDTVIVLCVGGVDTEHSTTASYILIC